MISPVDAGLASVDEPTIWLQDYETRCAPALVTRYLAEAVPTFAATGMAITEVARGLCRGLLPLSPDSANQHGTHQALLMAMLADYTGGMALASIFHGEPVLGVHPCRGEAGMSLWLTDVVMKYLASSVRPVTATACISQSEWATLRARYDAGESIFHAVELAFVDDLGKQVAKGKLTYFVRKRLSLAPRSADEPMHVMFRHGLTTSARLIAALRAMETVRDDRLFTDEWSGPLAGPQGEVIATRFRERIPWLPLMVAARTRSADDAIRQAYRDGVRQLVLLPAGLDSRPFRLAAECPDLRVFEADLPEMIGERNACIAALGTPPVNRVSLPLNLEFVDPGEALATVGLQLSEPVFVVYEGCAMYFEPDLSPVILRKMAGLIRGNSRSRMWFDLPTNRAVQVSVPDPSLRAFMDGMARLGAQFRFGHDDTPALARECGLTIVKDVPSDYIRPNVDRIFDEYRFLLVRAS